MYDGQTVKFVDIAQFVFIISLCLCYSLKILSFLQAGSEISYFEYMIDSKYFFIALIHRNV